MTPTASIDARRTRLLALMDGYECDAARVTGIGTQSCTPPTTAPRGATSS